MPKNELGDLKELRADRSLLNPDFDHYLLSSRKSEMHKINLSVPALHHGPSAEQWGYQHAKAFSSAEQLVLDLFVVNEDHLYVFTETGSLLKVVYKTDLANFVSSSQVATVAFPADKSNCFPPSLVFVDKKHALVSNGAGQLAIFKTHDRAAANQRWTEVFSYTLMDDSNVDNFVIHNTVDKAATGAPFLILDVRSTNDSQLSILLQMVIANKNAESGQQKAPFFTRLVWLNVKMTENELPNIERHRELNYAAHLELATLSHDARELITAGSIPPVFIYDSAKPITENKPETEGHNETSGGNSENPVYVWTQDAEEITVNFASAEPIERADVDYRLTSDAVSVSINGVKLLSGPLEGAVHLDASTWSIVDKKNLQITLFKVRGHFWKDLVKNDHRGLYEQDPQQLAQTLESLAKFTSDKEALSSSGAQSSTLNADQLEECDNSEEQIVFICWSNGDEHRCTQSMDASCFQFLFHTRISPGGPRSFATRVDNDAVVWSLDEVDLEVGKRICHKFTLNAFGYVQAGHSRKLFSGCAPDANYGVIVHESNHAFVYLQNVPVANGCQLRNRKTAKNHQNISEQLVLNTSALFDQTIESPNFIGFRTSNNVLFLLTRGHIVACHIH